ncbi:MAG TPA: DUF3107 domain-containing protein [Acidimicrobiales bacterium]|nr:DUF3107 domain-containing protein [Acidimicrobiales bacterium]
MEIRIGVTQTPREIEVDLEDGDAAALRSQVESAVGSETGMLWLTDRRGRTVGVPAAKIAYIEISPQEERRVGFAVS